MPSRLDKPTWRDSWVLKCTLLFALVGLFLGGVIWAGRWGLEQLQGSDRYVIAFNEIECEPPVAMERQKFLDEVRYYASPRLPERLNMLEDDLPKRLTDGFAKHPWVEKVDDVAIKPPKRVVVKLIHRTPVLAVKVGAELLAVDSAGVLLPKNAPTLGLPVFPGDARPPQEIGQRWGDPNVEAAARKARK